MADEKKSNLVNDTVSKIKDAVTSDAVKNAAGAVKDTISKGGWKSYLTKKNIIIGCVILVVLVIGIGIGASDKEKSTSSVQVSEKKISGKLKVTAEEIDLVKRCFRDRFYAHMKNQLDFDCFVKTLRSRIGDNQFYSTAVGCKKFLNPAYELTPEDAEIIKKYGLPTDNPDLLNNIGFKCGKF